MIAEPPNGWIKSVLGAFVSSACGDYYKSNAESSVVVHGAQSAQNERFA
jgi:hypothetical protein